MPYVNFQHCFHLKKCKILYAKRMSLNSAGDVVPLTNVNWRLITAPLVLSLWHWKRKRPSTYPYSWATQCKEGFHGFPSRNELYTVSFCFEHSLACDRHIWWLTKTTILKSLWKLTKLSVINFDGISLRKRDLYLMQRAISFLWRWSRKISNALLSN